jgi:hypothetical protein
VTGEERATRRQLLEKAMGFAGATSVTAGVITLFYPMGKRTDVWQRLSSTGRAKPDDVFALIREEAAP